MRTHWSTLADALGEVEALTLVETPGDAQSLVDNLADTLAEVEAVTLCDRQSDAHALVDTLAHTLPEVDAATLSERWHALVDALADTRSADTTTHEAMRTHWSTLCLTRFKRWRR